MTYSKAEGRYVSYLSESGSLELFMFASTTSSKDGFNRFKKVNQDLAIVSGYVPMPQIHALGYHFCKWANVSAEMIMQRN